MKIILPSIGFLATLAFLGWLAYINERPDLGRLFLGWAIGLAVLGGLVGVVVALIKR